jgi:hypothetical protein
MFVSSKIRIDGKNRICAVHVNVIFTLQGLIKEFIIAGYFVK